MDLTLGDLAPRKAGPHPGESAAQVIFAKNDGGRHGATCPVRPGMQCCSTSKFNGRSDDMSSDIASS
jgi:hypothetical protein